MNGWRSRSGLANATVAVALALALLGPGPSGSPTPGGDEGSRSTPGQWLCLMVNLTGTTCAAVTPDGTVFTGTAGGGIADWTSDGTLTDVFTTVNGLPSNHIVDLAVAESGTYALAVSPGTSLLVTGSSGHGWGHTGEIPGATGPLRLLRGGDQLLVLDDRGTVFISGDAPAWEQPDLPGGVSDEGWQLADIDGDILALWDGQELVVVDLGNGNVSRRHTPPLSDLDLEGDFLAIATDDHPDVLNLSSGLWLDENVTAAFANLGSDWSQVDIEGGLFRAANLSGLVVLADIEMDDQGDLELAGSIGDGVGANVTDMVALDNLVTLLATDKGTWVVGNRNARPFVSESLDMPPANDLLSTCHASGTVWVVGGPSLAGLALDDYGQPTSWLQGPSLSSPPAAPRLTALDIDGTVHFVGLGPIIHTYDTFTSSKPSRWGVIDWYDMPNHRANVMDIATVGGIVYVATDKGLDVLIASEPPSFERVQGSPANVACVEASGGELLVGTTAGLWRYDTAEGTWTSPGQVGDWLPKGTVGDVAVAGEAEFIAVDEKLYWKRSDGSVDSKDLGMTSGISRLASYGSEGSWVWSIGGGEAVAYLPSEDGEARVPGLQGFGNAVVRDLCVTPDGTAYIATDSGLHRLEQYGSVWRVWTTSEGLSANDIRDLEVRPDSDELWIGAYGGVDILDTEWGSVTRVGSEDGLPSDQVYDILFDGDGVWFATDVGGAARTDADLDPWYYYNMSTGLIAEDVQAIAVAGDKVLFGTDEGVTVLDTRGSTFSSHTASSTSGGLPDDWVNCAIPRGEDILVGTDRGLGVYSTSDDTWEAVKVDGIEGEQVRSLAWDGEGRLMVGTGHGLVVLEGDPAQATEALATLDRDDGLPGEEVLSLMPGSDGFVWAGTSAGVALVDHYMAVHTTFTTRDGLVHDRVNSITEFPAGDFWLGTAGGLSKVWKQRWHLLQQWSEVTVGIPDVYIALDDVRVVPEEPNANENVTLTVTVHNPSGLRAIVHVGLFEDDGGTWGNELDSAIAYTEAGGSYDITLSWWAVGGEQNLWVVVDPRNLVPETNERNNVVAINLHVNYAPEFLDINVSSPQIIGGYPDQKGYVAVEFLYRDLDGERPVSITGMVAGSSGSEDIQVPGGDPRDGIEMGHGFTVPMGNSTVVIVASDGRASVNVSIPVSIHFAIDVSGLEDGPGENGVLRFSVSALQPWEGHSIAGVEVWLVEPGTDPADPRVWQDQQFHTANRDGDAWTYRTRGLPAGTYDVWVLATDDRVAQALYVEEGVTIPETEEAGSSLWIPLVIIAALAAISVAVAVTRPKGRGG